MQPGEAVGSHAERLRDALVPLIEHAYEQRRGAAAPIWTRSSRQPTARPDSPTSPPTSRSNHPTPPATWPGPPSIDEDWLVISTVHSAKGLEWDVVHILNAADGNFPSDMALTTKEGLEEERRLFYVAVTRPRRAAARLRPAAVPLPATGPRRRPHVRPAVEIPDGRRSTSCFDATRVGTAEAVTRRAGRRRHQGRARARRAVELSCSPCPTANSTQ